MQLDTAKSGIARMAGRFAALLFFQSFEKGALFYKNNAPLHVYLHFCN
ncbi:hypothetical protein SLL00_07945 [Metabacillus indicus]|nr:hypothetical protein [Metabacillus indicus]MDX8289722.1 hypothetical protein [Metabacillus indicus]